MPRLAMCSVVCSFRFWWVVWDPMDLSVSLAWIVSIRVPSASWFRYVAALEVGTKRGNGTVELVAKVCEDQRLRGNVLTWIQSRAQISEGTTKLFVRQFGMVLVMLLFSQRTWRLCDVRVSIGHSTRSTVRQVLQYSLRPIKKPHWELYSGILPKRHGILVELNETWTLMYNIQSRRKSLNAHSWKSEGPSVSS